MGDGSTRLSITAGIRLISAVFRFWGKVDTCIFVYDLILSLHNKFYMSFCFVARMRTRFHHEESSCRTPSPVVSFPGFVFDLLRVIPDDTEQRSSFTVGNRVF